MNLIRNSLHDKRPNSYILEFGRFSFNYIKIISFKSSLQVLFYPLPIPYYDCVILLETNNFSMHFGNISNSVSNA